MTQKSLLQMLEELASKVRSFERDKREAALTIQRIERQLGEPGSLFSTTNTTELARQIPRP